MLTLGWLLALSRGSNWKFKFDLRAKLRIASVSGTFSMTMSGTPSLAGVAASGGAPAGWAGVVVAWAGAGGPICGTGPGLAGCASAGFWSAGLASAGFASAGFGCAGV